MPKLKQIIPIEQVAEEYSFLRDEKKRIEARMKTLAETIKTYATNHGSKDDKGSFYSNVKGYVIGKQAKTSVKFDEEKALQWFSTHGLTDCIATKQIINEEAVETHINNGDISYEDLEGIIKKSVTYAVDVKKEDEMAEVEEHTVVQIAASKK